MIRSHAWLALALVASSIPAQFPARDRCDRIVTFATGVRPLRELHVATWGSDATGNGSRGRPYATIAFAARQATPGTAVRVGPGTYAGGGFVYDLHGRADAPIWIGGTEAAGGVVIDGGTEGLHLVRPRYLVVHDLEIKNATGNGLNCDDGGEYANPDAARHVVFQRLHIHDIGGTGNQDGLKLSGLDDYTVLGCRFERCGGGTSGSGIDHVGCHRGLIARCRFEQMSGNAVQCKGGSEDIEIRWCRLIDPGQRGVNIGGSTGFQFFRPPLSTSQPNVEARNIRVIANEIVGGVAALAFVGCVDSVAAHNTIIDPDNWIFRILQETNSGSGYTFSPCANNRFFNNLVYYERARLRTWVNIGPGTQAATFSFAHDLWYARDNPAASQPALPAPEVGAVVGVDPRLLDPGRGQYGLGPGSPARRAGLGPPPIAGDIQGWCFADPPSIGAHESR